jgi:glycosyltransferase involved in cell wall biosynthesis
MKKKVLLLGDDMRLNSGIGTMSKAIVEGTLGRFDWVQIGGAIKHPNAGEITDLSEKYQKDLGIEDAYCKIYATNGYGNPDSLREVLAIEKPDIILHFTDPRYWEWLYAMEHEIRQITPLGYINIWDDLPFPRWNEDFYESCDLLMAISKQTYNINKHVCQRKPRVEGKDLFYTPHGINENEYFPISSKDPDQISFKNKSTNFEDYKFIAFLNSRNIRRKGIADLLAGFKLFRSKLPKDVQEKVAIILHTDPVDNNGTDLPVVANALDPDMKVIFSTQKLPVSALNRLYNVADVVCNPSSAEGFGLSHMEAMMSGTPTIATVVGGLQDQMGFKNKEGEFITIKDFTAEVPSNSTGMMTEEHGPWTYPLWPNQSIQGSPTTPYIYDSRPTIEDIALGLRYWYDAGAAERKRCGSIGRDWAIENGFSAKNMCDTTANAISTCLENFKPRQRYAIIDTSKLKQKYPIGDLI